MNCVPNVYYPARKKHQFAVPKGLASRKQRVSPRTNTVVEASFITYNVTEYADRYELAIAVPGYSKENINVSIDGDLITISGQIEQTADKTYLRKEFSPKNFKKVFRASDKMDMSKISAKYQSGILNLEIGKKDEAIPTPPRSIDIQ